VGQHDPDGVLVTALHLGTRRTIAQLLLGGATIASLRLAGPSLAIADDRGCAIVVDLERVAVRRDLRVS
jgi:hypothetical protein